MNKQTFAALSKSVYMHIIELISKGDIQQLSEVGLTQNQIQKIQSMRSVEAEKIFTRKAQIFDLKINQSVFNRVLEDIDQERFIDDCINAGAPNDFLYHFFGLIGRDATKRRQSLGYSASKAQRSPKSESEAALIERLYLEILGSREPGDFDAKDYYALYLRYKHSTGKEITIKAIWFTCHRLLEDGCDSDNMFPDAHLMNQGSKSFDAQV